MPAGGAALHNGDPMTTLPKDASRNGLGVGHSLAVLEGDAPTQDKREAMSAIGRRRDPQFIPLLMRHSRSPNPDVALQAIRGLLALKRFPEVADYLWTLAAHPNDMVRDVLAMELQDGRSVEDNHAASPDFMKNVIVHGDVLETMASVPDRSVHLTFTSPPYFNAREYSKYQSYEEYLGFLDQVFSEVHRVTKEGRFFVLNTSPVIAPRAGRKYASRRYPVPYDVHARLTANGWEFIDDIVWAKPEKSAKNRVAGFEMHRKPLTYKTNARTEMLMVYRKKSYELIDWNLRQYPEDIVEKSKVDDDFERSNVWNIAPTTDSVHSAVFPTKLCEQVVKLYSFVGDLVFDPFAGSGTLGLTAAQLKRNFFLTEMNIDYIVRMQSRIMRAASVISPPMRIMHERDFRRSAAGDE